MRLPISPLAALRTVRVVGAIYGANGTTVSGVVSHKELVPGKEVRYTAPIASWHGGIITALTVTRIDGVKNGVRLRVRGCFCRPPRLGSASNQAVPRSAVQPIGRKRVGVG